jgi:hypothetical protein
MQTSFEMMHVILVHRKQISLYQAVSAFSQGWYRDGSPPPTFRASALACMLDKLQDAARAGKIKFRAIPLGGKVVPREPNEYPEIDPIYFTTNPYWRWNENNIQFQCNPPANYQDEQDWVSKWYDVRLDREQFASLLREMGITVEPNSDSDAPDNSKIYSTGLQGRPTAIHLALPIAQLRLNAGDYPETKKMFSEQIAEAAAKAHPQAPPMKPKSLMNNPEFSELWRRRSARPK